MAFFLEQNDAATIPISSSRTTLVVIIAPTVFVVLLLLIVTFVVIGCFVAYRHRSKRYLIKSK